MLWPQQAGEQVGLNWRIRRTTKKHAPIRHGVYDTNFWKSFMHARLFVPMGGWMPVAVQSRANRRIGCWRIIYTPNIRFRLRVRGGR
jgi:hypothetical protein